MSDDVSCSNELVAICEFGFLELYLDVCAVHMVILVYMFILLFIYRGLSEEMHVFLYKFI